MVIAGPVNNDFKSLEKLMHCPTGWGPRTERLGVDDLLAVGGRDVTDDMQPFETIGSEF